VILGIGLAVGQTLLAWDRGAAPTEVLAPALYIPVFAGAIFLSIPGGLGAAALSSLIYGVLLSDTAAAVGLRVFALQLVTRIGTYFFYGVVIAVGARYVERRLRKLELYDQLDDLTELYNSAFFLEDTDLEMSRSNRYQTLFSVSELDVHREAFAGFSRRRYQRVIKDLAAHVRDAVRRVDRPVRVDDGERDRFLVMLPETARQGAEVFTGRLESRAREFLRNRGCDVDGHVSARAIAYPDNPDDLGQLREEVARVDAERRAIREE
jgi:GGDEF domain-containing protein